MENIERQWKYNDIPESTWESLEAYREGKHPYYFGGFLAALMSGAAITEVFGRADAYNRAAMPQLATYLANELPSHVYGSPERYAAEISRQYDLHYPDSNGRDPGL